MAEMEPLLFRCLACYALVPAVAVAARPLTTLCNLAPVAMAGAMALAAVVGLEC
jgi:hypothetical protein